MKRCYKPLLTTSFFLLMICFCNAQVKWKSVSAGPNTVALKNDGTLWEWGRNSNGQLGTGDTVQHLTPVKIGNDTNWLKAVAGANYTVALKSNGTVWSWGTNTIGQLGNGTYNEIHSPVQIGTDTWIKIATGAGSTVAIKSDSSLWGWGSNFNGELGIGFFTTVPTPVLIDGTKKWIDVTAGQNRTMALRSDKTIWGWGWNFDGELGNGNTIDQYQATQAGIDNDWKFIASGAFNSFAIKNNGTLWAWGWNHYGEAGIGNTIQQLVPVQVGTDTDWVSLSVYQNVLALKRDDSIWAWGQNTFGELGLQNNTEQDVPVRIPYLSNIAEVSAGADESAVIDGTRDNICMTGDNRYGQLGDGTFASRNKFLCGFLKSTLAITFLNIAGYETNHVADISWGVASESNILYYRIEKSINGNNFVIIASLNPATNAGSFAKYHWIDVRAKGGNNFYRIRAIERTGSETVSSVIDVKIGIAGSSISVFSNPVENNTINLDFNNLPGGYYQVVLVNSAGQQIALDQIQHTGGSSIHSLNFKNSLPKGVYILQVKSGQEQYNQKVVIN